MEITDICVQSLLLIIPNCSFILLLRNGRGMECKAEEKGCRRCSFLTSPPCAKDVEDVKHQQEEMKRNEEQIQKKKPTR
jgi:hypothetical protein